MLAQKFFTLFPPPKFLDTPYAGLDISDDAIRCIEYTSTRKGLSIHRYGMKELPGGAVSGGEIKDSKILADTIKALAKELKIHVVRASLPEEKMYLFKTDVTSNNNKEIRQNIEFKLEENVPISPADSIFFFDRIPNIDHKEDRHSMSVSVAPNDLINSYLDTIRSAGVSVYSFELQAKAIARALVPFDSKETEIIVHIMNNKTGVYVACGGVVCFTSTIPWGNRNIITRINQQQNFTELQKQINQVHAYWLEHGRGAITRVVFTGKGALTDGLISACAASFANDKGNSIRFEVGKTWRNAFSCDLYIPSIAYEDSLDYVVAAGLAMPTFMHY